MLELFFLLQQKDISQKLSLTVSLSGGLLMSRSFAVLVTMTLSTSVAAREGPLPMAGHQICLQVWLALSLLTDALALAGQVVLPTVCSCFNSCF